VAETLREFHNALEPRCRGCEDAKSIVTPKSRPDYHATSFCACRVETGFRPRFPTLTPVSVARIVYNTSQME